MSHCCAATKLALGASILPGIKQDRVHEGLGTGWPRPRESAPGEGSLQKAATCLPAGRRDHRQQPPSLQGPPLGFSAPLAFSGCGFKVIL